MGSKKREASQGAAGGWTAANRGAQSVLTQLPDLKTSDLKKVKQHADTLLNMRSGGDTDDEVELVYSALTDAAGRGGMHTRLMGFGEFKRAHKKHVPALEEAAAFLEMTARNCDVRRKPQRRRLYSLCWLCLRDELRMEGSSATPIGLIEAWQRLPDAIDNAYPGYSDAGMLGVLVRPQVNKEPKL